MAPCPLQVVWNKIRYVRDKTPMDMTMWRKKGFSRHVRRLIVDVSKALPLIISNSASHFFQNQKSTPLYYSDILKGPLY